MAPEALALSLLHMLSGGTCPNLGHRLLLGMWQWLSSSFYLQGWVQVEMFLKHFSPHLFEGLNNHGRLLGFFQGCMASKDTLWFPKRLEWARHACSLL